MQISVYAHLWVLIEIEIKEKSYKNKGVYVYTLPICK